jgi:hypothetical protein
MRLFLPGIFTLAVSYQGPLSLTIAVEVGATAAFQTGGFNTNISAVSAVPVPAAFWLFGSGLLGMIGIARKRKASS